MSSARAVVGKLWATLCSIRVRLTLWYVALLAVTLLAFSAFLYLSLRRSLETELDQTLQQEARQAAATLNLESGQPRLGEGPEHLPSGVVVALFDGSGQHLIANDPRLPLPAVAEALSKAAQGEQTETTLRLADGSDWRVMTLPVVDGQRIVGVLQVARSRRDMDAALRELVVLITLSLPVTLLLASAGGLFLAGRALNPIDRITRTAALISIQDLSRRLGLPATRDEVGRLAATFDRMLDRLEGAFQRQRQFTADAAHELRTPLAILTSQADVALGRQRSADEYREALISMREDASRMARLLGDLLTLARADAGAEVLTLETLAVRDLVSDVLGAMAPMARARGVDLRGEWGETALVSGDQTRLTQLLVNLLDNAIKYTPGGGMVSVSTRRDGRYARIDVRDSGPGIAPEHLAHVFERFYRVDPSRSRGDGGAGLGLAISQWIAHAHGGEITAHSQPGQGSTFTLRLPAATPGGSGQATPAPSPHQTKGER